jgi:hypothetical protein
MMKIAALMLGVFVLGLAVGFDLCIRRFVRPAIAIAKEANTHSKECLAAMEDLQAATKRFLVQFQGQAKPPKRIVH